ncbi:MAG: hypothetical protein ACRDGW_02265 [Actinomycetota bacterium]
MVDPTDVPPTDDSEATDPISRVPLIDVVLDRRSRRFGLGAKLEGGPLAYTSRHEPVPLTKQEEAILAFAAAGCTGYALGELPYSPGSRPESGSGNIMFSMLGRTVASPDAHHNVVLFIVNDEGAFMMRRPQDFVKSEIPELIELARQRDFIGLYERSRVRIAEERPDPPREMPFVPPFNKWSTNLPGGTYFIPVNEVTTFYVNALLNILSEEFGFFIVDERNGFKPAGLKRFGRSAGGHLRDDPNEGRVVTVQYLETYILEMSALEQGLMLQNLALTAEALGLGGFPHYAAHHFAWFNALGFRMKDLRLSDFMRKGQAMSWIMTRIGKNPVIPVPIGVERDGQPLIRPYCPPWFPSMTDAVRALIDFKYSKEVGTYRDGGKVSAWKDPERVQAGIPDYSPQEIEATTAYLEYLWDRYGRILANFGAFRTNLGYQVHHVDLDYYDEFYKPGAYTDLHRGHFERWHPNDAGGARRVTT